MAVCLLIKALPEHAAAEGRKRGIELTTDGMWLGYARAFASDRDTALVQAWFIEYNDDGPAPEGTLMWYRQDAVMPATLAT